MGNEVPFLSTWPIKIWAFPMAMGFCFPYDSMVENQCIELDFRYKNNVTKAKQ